MKIFEIIMLSIGISMDSFAVALSKGLSCEDSYKKTALVCGLWFSLFQALFPCIGYLLGMTFAEYIDRFDHYIIFFIFLLLGVNLIKDAVSPKQSTVKSGTNTKDMFLISLALSVDSLAIGITLALLEVKIIFSVCIIALLTFLVTILGVFVGHRFGKKYKKQASIIGGIILILLGTEILLQHLLL